jgi:hypothetical protein
LQECGGTILFGSLRGRFSLVRDSPTFGTIGARGAEEEVTFERVFLGCFGVFLMVAGVYKHTLISAGMPGKDKPKYHLSTGQRIVMVIGGALMLYMAATNQM